MDKALNAWVGSNISKLETEIKILKNQRYSNDISDPENEILEKDEMYIQGQIDAYKTLLMMLIGK